MLDTSQSIYTDEFQDGVDHVMHDLHELLFDKKNFSSEQDREVIRKVYELLHTTYPEKL